MAAVAVLAELIKYLLFSLFHLKPWDFFKMSAVHLLQWELLHRSETSEDIGFILGKAL